MSNGVGGIDGWKLSGDLDFKTTLLVYTGIDCAPKK